MYRTILKEIGAEESNMNYLFEDDENDDDDRGWEENNSIVPEGAADHENCTNGIAVRQLQYDQTRQDKLFDDTDDDDLLKQWEESEDGDVVDLIETSEEKRGGNNLDNREIAWKNMLKKATFEQEQLMDQMNNLQMVQRKSSPRNTIKENPQYLSPEEEKKWQEGKGSENDNENEGDQTSSSPMLNSVKRYDDPDLSGISSTQLMQHLSSRNVKLQDEWQSQQVETAKLQEKMNVIQAKFNDQQKQWEKDQKDLFSPTRSKTKIPRWQVSTGSATTPSLPSKVLITDWDSPRSDTNLRENLENKIRQLEKQLDESAQANKSQTVAMDGFKNQMEERDMEHQNLIRQYEEGQELWQDKIKEMNAKHKVEIGGCQKELEDIRDKLKIQISTNQDLREENEKVKLSTQFEELLSTRFEEELEEAKNKVKLVKEEQTQKIEQIKAHVEEIENSHDEELKVWKNKVDDHRNRIKIENDNFVSQLEEANTRYLDLKHKYEKGVNTVHTESRHTEDLSYWKNIVDDQKQQLETCRIDFESQLTALEQKHGKEVKEWQTLLHENISKKEMEERNADNNSSPSALNGNVTAPTLSMMKDTSLKSLSPIQKKSSTQQYNKEGETSGDSFSSSISIDSVPSESMAKIDGLLEELGEIDSERTAILDEIHCKSKDKKVEVHQVVPKDIDESVHGETTYGYYPRLPESIASIEQKSEESASNTTNDSEVLDQTLSLLYNLKNMMTCEENGSMHETSVLERLEVLSELMDGQSGYQNLVSSVDQEYSGKDIPASRDINTSWNSILTGVADNPWQALVLELRNRCEFLERDRDDLARITEQILESERLSHRVELEAAVSTAVRKANESLHEFQVQINREKNRFYRNICFSCQKRVSTTS